MRRLQFVPARSSRHRSAALALYRALLRAGKQVPLPQEVQSSSLNNPIANLLRRRYEKARIYDSLRLVFSAMTAGYKSLGVLTNARDQSSSDHARVVAYLRNHPHNFPRPKALSQIQSPSKAILTSSPIRPTKTPLLTKVQRPGEAPTYVSNFLPRPKEAFEGPRHVPRLAITANGQPFLRTKKPQSAILSRMVRKKDLRYFENMQKFSDIEEEEIADSILEDQWEHLVELQMKKEKQTVEPLPHLTESYCWNTQLSWLWYLLQIQTIWMDWNARGQALHNIVEQEKALAEAEKAADVPRHNLDPAPRTPPQPVDPKQTEALRIFPHDPHALSKVASLAESGGRTEEERKDQFNSRGWRAVVLHQHDLLTRRTSNSLDGRKIGQFVRDPKSMGTNANTAFANAGWR